MLAQPPEADTQINAVCCRYHAAPTQYVVLQMSIYTQQHNANTLLRGQHMAANDFFCASVQALNTFSLLWQMFHYFSACMHLS